MNRIINRNWTQAALLLGLAPILSGCPIPLMDFGQGFAVVLRGTDIGEERMVPDIDGDGEEDIGLCFDLEAFSLVSGQRLGTATDCLSNVTEVGDALTLVATTEFNLPMGDITTRGMTTVQPILVGNSPFSHSTSADPAPGDNSVLSGTGIFAGAEGESRLSGLVLLNPMENGDLEITFDCIFVVELDAAA